MKSKALFLACLFCVSYQAHSQYYFYDDRYYDNDLVLEIGGSLGAMNSLTDLGGRRGRGKEGVKDFNIRNTQLSGSFFLSAIYRYDIAIRLEGTFGGVKGYDSILRAVAPTTEGRYERNLNFRSPITEIMLAAEFYPVLIFRKFNQDVFPSLLQPYVMGGVAYFHFNPQTKLNNNWIDLQPLHTEGQGFKEYPDRKIYSLNQLSFPIGIGAKYEATSFLNLRLELLWRLLTTDYLDDVSSRYINPAYFPAYLSGTKLKEALLLHDRHKPGAVTAHIDGIRGNPKNNDSYFNLNFKLSFIFNRERR
ncbi:MAG: hypothetical protein ABJA71_14105 [Ginsengibacter sp.]